jgi:hypothetical protein
MILKEKEMKKAINNSDGLTSIKVVELYNDGELRLEEIRVMLGDECIAKSWREYNGKTEEQGGSDDMSYYTLPKWYQRYKKIDEIL